MKITFLGGTETVTGSKFLVESSNTKILVDCGLFQGYKWLRERNRHNLPFDIKTIDAVLLTHAHLDHSGYIPVLYKKGYRGPVYTHHASVALCNILLPDSGHIQEDDARYYSKHKIGRHSKPEPLYDKATAIDSMSLFKGVDFEDTITVGDMRFFFQPAGHILGAASIILELEDKRIAFSGDVGRPNDLFMHPPQPLPDVDAIFLESTYGNREHDEDDVSCVLERIINETAEQGGVLLIPSFAVGRAQLLQHLIASLMMEGKVPKIPLYLDSPMAISVSDIYCQYSAWHRLTKEQCHTMSSLPVYTRDVESSRAITDQKFPHIVIAGSGMATGGRILHHFKRLLGKPNTRVLFAGFQAGGTRGAKMLSGADKIKIHGQMIPVRAKIEMLSNLSSHGDYLEIEKWLLYSKLAKTTKIYLIHGEADALEYFRVHLDSNTDFEVHVAGYRDILTL